MNSTGILIGEVSESTGCHVETIRYYERIGLLSQVPRRGRYRCYRVEDVARLRFIVRARELGFSLHEVRALLSLANRRGIRSCTSAQALAASNLENVRAKIADLERLARTLTEVLSQCQSGTAEYCPLLQALGGPQLRVRSSSIRD
jgi:MerR family mercuric resistance operon transcriptional regulator